MEPSLLVRRRERLGRDQNRNRPGVLSPEAQRMDLDPAPRLDDAKHGPRQGSESVRRHIRVERIEAAPAPGVRSPVISMPIAEGAARPACSLPDVLRILY